MTFPGAPSIYYGDEVGLVGAIDPDSRRGFPVESAWNHELLDTHRQLIAIRHKYPCLRTGDYKVLFTQGELYIFSRTLENEELIIAVNSGTTSAQATLDTTDFNYQLIYGQAETQQNTTGDSRQLKLNLPPRTGCILQAVSY
jgi:cyclomaltodextrinase / maltogenic alpha-amylase / neopullulanase